MAIAAAEPAPADVMTWARGSTTLPAPPQPIDARPPCAVDDGEAGVVESAAEAPEEVVGVRDVGRTDEDGGSVDDPPVDELEPGEAVVLDHEPGDLTVHHPDAARFELGRLLG